MTEKKHDLSGVQLPEFIDNLTKAKEREQRHNRIARPKEEIRRTIKVLTSPEKVVPLHRVDPKHTKRQLNKKALTAIAAAGIVATAGITNTFNNFNKQPVAAADTLSNEMSGWKNFEDMLQRRGYSVKTTEGFLDAVQMVEIDGKFYLKLEAPSLSLQGLGRDPETNQYLPLDPATMEELTVLLKRGYVDEPAGIMMIRKNLVQA